MKITKIKVINFRLLEDVTVALDPKSTMVVGRNNSGKTSLVEIFRKFFDPSTGRFTFDDISLNSHQLWEVALDAFVQAREFRILGNEAQALIKDEVCKNSFPEIQLSLSFEYDPSDDLALISPFIMDLDPGRTDATILFSLKVEDHGDFLSDFIVQTELSGITLLDFVRNNFLRIYVRKVETYDQHDPKNRKLVTEVELRNFLSIKFIYAQTLIDDLSSDTYHGLSKGFESFYKSNKDDNAVVDEISRLLSTAGGELDVQYKDLFTPIFSDLKMFGIGRMGRLPELSVISQFDIAKLIVGNARLYYNEADEGKKLPEAHNGLGYSKLIFTILQFISFYEELRRARPRPAIQLIFVEEPEAHLHPQMQYVFMKNIHNFMDQKADWNAQIVITTHSSHVVAESGFSCVRYFDSAANPLEVRDLSEYETLQSESSEEALRFLKRYMVLNRCDMFFADKLILIEGAVERLLLPEMMIRDAESLLHQYVSVIEVGGAYAHLFRGIVEFLKIKTLIVTDIDSVDPANGNEAAPVAPGLNSSNQTLRSWLPGDSSIDGLLAASDSKIHGNVRVAYQIPESTGGKTGRSFEEAFFLANAAALLRDAEGMSVDRLLKKRGARLTKDEVIENSFGIADRIKKKTDFAFDILGMGEWVTPRYIKEGLEWLSQTP